MFGADKSSDEIQKLGSKRFEHVLRVTFAAAGERDTTSCQQEERFIRSSVVRCSMAAKICSKHML